MHIRQADEEDRQFLLDIWLRSVRATHTFVSPDDIESMIPHVREYLCALEHEFWLVCEAL